MSNQSNNFNSNLSISNSIQQQIELFTIMLEQEKRKSNILDSKIFSLQKKDENSEKLADQLRKNLTQLESELILEAKNLNKTVLENLAIQEEINIMRKSKIYKKEEIKNISEGIRENSGRARKVCSLSRDYSDLHQKSDGRLLNLRAKSVNSRKKIERKASELSIQISKFKRNRKDFLSLLEIRLEGNDFMRVDPVQTLNILKSRQNT